MRDATKTDPHAVHGTNELFRTYVADYFAGGRIGELGLKTKSTARTTRS